MPWYFKNGCNRKKNIGLWSMQNLIEPSPKIKAIAKNEEYDSMFGFHTFNYKLRSNLLNHDNIL